MWKQGASVDRYEVMTLPVETAQVYGRLLSFSYLSLMLFFVFILICVRLCTPQRLPATYTSCPVLFVFCESRKYNIKKASLSVLQTSVGDN